MKFKTTLVATAIGVMLAFGALAATPRDTLVVVKNIEDIVSLDPAEAYEFSSGEVVSNIYEGLIQYDAADPTKIRPGVAASWKTGTDGKNIEFTLRSDSKFASGNPV